VSRWEGVPQWSGVPDPESQTEHPAFLQKIRIDILLILKRMVAIMEKSVVENAHQIRYFGSLNYLEGSL
jgi:hypothetical protein